MFPWICNTLLLLILVTDFLSKIHCVTAAEAFAAEPFVSADNPCAGIRNGQFTCLDCATLGFCIQEGGEWITLEIGKCSTERQFYCDEDANGCTFQNECQLSHKGVKFECQNPGLYPDPFDCRYYHECNGMNENTRHVCPPGWGFIASTQSCSVRTNSTECQMPQYKCERPGEMASWPGDANLFYVCYVKRTDKETILYPLLYRCRSDYVFDGNICVPLLSFNTPETQPPSMDDKGSRAPATDSTPICNAANNNQLLANPSDCHAYFNCRNRKLVAYRCPMGSFFNSTTFNCQFGSC